MNIKPKLTALAGILALLLTGCAGTDTTADFGKISTTGPGHSTDTNRSGEMDGIGFVHRY